MGPIWNLRHLFYSVLHAVSVFMEYFVSCLNIDSSVLPQWHLVAGVRG